MRVEKEICLDCVRRSEIQVSTVLKAYREYPVQVSQRQKKTVSHNNGSNVAETAPHILPARKHNLYTTRRQSEQPAPQSRTHIVPFRMLPEAPSTKFSRSNIYWSDQVSEWYMIWRRHSHISKPQTSPGSIKTVHDEALQQQIAISLVVFLLLIKKIGPQRFFFCLNGRG